MTASSSKSRFPQGIKFPKALAAAGLAAVLVGCGGGSSSDTSMDSKPVPLPTTGLPSAFLPTPQTLSIPAGQSRIVGGIMFACDDGGLPCEVTIRDDGTTTATGGAVTASLTTAAQHTITQNAQRAGADDSISNAISVVGSIGNQSTDDQLAAAQKAIDDAKASIDAATALTQSDRNALSALVSQQQTLLNNKTDLRMAYIEENEDRNARTEQRQAANSAINKAITAIRSINNESTDDQLAAAQKAIDDAKASIDAATTLDDSERGTFSSIVSSQQTLLNTKKNTRTAYINEERDKNERKERERLAKEKKMRDDEAKLWIAAINDYTVKGNPNGFNSLEDHVSDLNINDKDNNIKIELDDQNGVPLEPMSHMDPSSGWIAQRFTNNDDYGVVVTSRKPKYKTDDKATEISWTEYFYKMHPKAEGARSSNDEKDPIPVGITPQEPQNGKQTGLLTIGPDAKFAAWVFGGSFPQFNLIKGGQSEKVTLYGVPGMLACPATEEPGCVTEDPDDDKMISFTGQPTFTPEVPSDADENTPFDDILVTLIEPGKTITDGDYLQFGYWITKTGSETKPKYNIHTFAENSGFGDTTSSIANLRGSASYSGGAAGVYVLKEGDPSNNPDLYNGEFIAGVDLKAQFGDDTGDIGYGKQWKITGSIDNFRSSTPDHDLSGWELTLEADLGDDRGTTDRGKVDTPSLSLTKPMTMGGGNTGTWNASFFGNVDADGDAEDYPEAIVGEFNGHFANGHVVGAFGAEVEE